MPRQQQRQTQLMRPAPQKLKAHTCMTGRYAGGEKCLLPRQGKFPVTKNGRLSCKRVRNVMPRAVQFGYVKKVLKAGYCAYARECGVKRSTYC